MSAIKQGLTLTQDHLAAYMYLNNNLSDPYTINYTLKDPDGNVIGLPNRIPRKFATGSYYAPWQVPNDEPIGFHTVEWKFKQSANSTEQTTIEDFSVVPICAGEQSLYPEMIMYLIKHLRIKLRDINPDKDYHFAPPSSEQTIMGFTRTRGYRWPDETLYFHLVQATNYINLIPPDTDFILTNIPAPWQPLVLLQAMIYALWDLAILWMNEEFVYSLNGISLDISRSDKYSGAAQALQGQMETQLEGAKRRIHIIRGLAQSKYTFSYGAALGPWVASKMSVKKWVVGSQSGRGFI